MVHELDSLGEALVEEIADIASLVGTVLRVDMTAPDESGLRSDDIDPFPEGGVFATHRTSERPSPISRGSVRVQRGEP